jgi:hypothetical protein
MSAILRTSKSAIQGGLALITLLAWFLISNHCALGVIGGLGAHPWHCHGSAWSTTAEQSACCKALTAVIAKSDASVDKTAFTVSFQTHIAPLTASDLSRPDRLSLDTGPPFQTSFAECVLQRSILAHAPPFSLS